MRKKLAILTVLTVIACSGISNASAVNTKTLVEPNGPVIARANCDHATQIISLPKTEGVNYYATLDRNYFFIVAYPQPGYTFEGAQFKVFLTIVQRKVNCLKWRRYRRI